MNFWLIFLLTGFIEINAQTFNCDVEINETYSSDYQQQIIGLNITNLKEVKEIRVLENNDLFVIDSNSVSLQTIRRIDRETLCKQYIHCDCLKPICLLDITVLVIYMTSRNMPPFHINKKICIVDINDNSPTFPENTQTLDLNEKVEPGTVYDLHSATDPDSERFGIIRYELKCPNDIFNLSYSIPKKGMYRSDHQVKVYVTKIVVYQSEVIACIFSACDIDSCTKITLLVTINDINDNRPKWKNNIYYQNIKENILPDTVIGRYEATDSDPIYGKISYSIGRIIILSDSKASSDGLFTIDSSSGELRINKNLNYEEASYRKFEVILVAKDNGNPTLSSSATVSISVENINDNSPAIKLNMAILEIKENSGPIYLDYFTVSDDDQMGVDRITCQVTEPENVFRLKKQSQNNPIIFEIHSLGSFDFEKQNTISMMIKCDDGGIPSLNSVRRLTVNILDVNDNKVYFPQKELRISIQENAPIGTDLIKLLALDLDRKSSLLFSLVNPENCSFVNLDTYRGYLTTNEVFDRENKDLYVFKVKVEEKDFTNFSDIAEIYLTITDTNDNNPTFKEQYTFNLAENVSINTIVGKIEAFDLDLGNNRSITYFHGPQIGKGLDYFRVESNGVIRLFQQLDFETQTIHNLVIIARDQGNAIRLSASTSVIIKVIDSNDHPPKFEEKSVNHPLLCQSQEIGKDLIIVSDKDQSPENKIVNYEIEKVVPSKFKSMFNINKTNGFISMFVNENQCKFKFSSHEKVDITLQIFDPTKREFKDRANIILTLENDKYDKQLEHEKSNKNDKANNYFTKNKQKQNYGDGDGQLYSKDFVDQNVIIVMILIFITIFLGIVLISLVCFIKKRRENEDEQDAAESIGMIREKATSPMQSSKTDYGKNSESYSLTMKNIGANDCYYPTMMDNLRSKAIEESVSSNYGKNTGKKTDGNLFQYETQNIKDNNAFQSMTMNPRIDEQYSIIESFLINSQMAPRNKSQDESNCPNIISNRPYVSVSFV